MARTATSDDSLAEPAERSNLAALVGELRQRLELVRAGGGPQARARHEERGS